MSVSLSPNLPANVVEIGNEISQAKINEINAGTLALQTWVTSGFAPKASPTFTGIVTIPAGASIAGYLTDAPSNGNEYVRKNATWSIATGGGGGLTISSLSNSAATTLNATAPTTGQALTFDGTELKWATVGGGGGGVVWGGITGTVTDQTDLTTYIGGLGYIAGTSASQLTNGTYTTNPTAAPTTAGDVLQFNGTALVWAASGGGGTTWGSITGTLSNQTDLQNALDTKLQAKTVNTVTSSPYTVQLSDARKVVYLASGGMGFTIQADNDSSIAYVDGTEITIVVDNPSFGYSVLAGPGPVTINGGASGPLTNYVSNLVKVAANTWFVS